MKESLAAIEQEIKFTQDANAGTRQYRTGYVAALESVAAFLGLQEGERSPRVTDSAAVKRLLSCVPLRFREDMDGHEEAKAAIPISTLEKESIEIALGVLRCDSDHADFLNWWLREYGRKVLSPEPNRRSPLFPDVPAPTTEAELDLLEAELDRFAVLTSDRYGRVHEGITAFCHHRLDSERTS